MPHPILSSIRRRDSHLLRPAWHTPVPVSDGLMDVNVSDHCAKLHLPRTIPHFSSSAQLQRDKRKLHGGKKPSGITEIYYEKENLSNCPKGGNFCITHPVLTSCFIREREC